MLLTVWMALCGPKNIAALRPPLFVDSRLFFKWGVRHEVELEMMTATKMLNSTHTQVGPGPLASMAADGHRCLRCRQQLIIVVVVVVIIIIITIIIIHHRSSIIILHH